jgi:hypothetical protein
MEKRGDAPQFWLFSCVIVAVLGLQLLAIISRPGEWTWPFIDYPMYSGSHQEGERIPSFYTVTATTKDGRVLQITPEDLGVNFWVFHGWARALGRAAEQQAAWVSSSRTDAVGSFAARAKPWPVREWLKSTWLYNFLKPRPDPDLAAVLLDHVMAQKGLELASLRIEDAAVIVTRGGPAPAPPQVIELKLPLQSVN